MIPGPVTGRAPIDPGAAQRSQAEAGGDAAEGGASFADLLAAMLAPGAAPAVPSEAGAAGTPEIVFERLDAAEVFNETGLFRGAAPLTAAGLELEGTEPPAAVGRPDARAREFQAALTPPTSATDAVSAPALPTAAAAQASAAGSDGQSVPAYPASNRATPSRRGQAVAVTANPPPGPGASRAAAGAGRASPRTAAMLAQAFLAKGSMTAAQLSVQAVEGGISLVARADKLSREERDRLRIEIGELLARHGFGMAELRLNGEAWPSPQGRND